MGKNHSSSGVQGGWRKEHDKPSALACQVLSEPYGGLESTRAEHSREPVSRLLILPQSLHSALLDNAGAGEMAQ